MAGSDTSLWPVVVGGLLGVGGTLVGMIGATIRDAAQQRHEKAKRRADKFEELVAAVYEFDHWLDGIRLRDAIGIDNSEPQRASPFAKVQAISSVYFPQFNDAVAELDEAATKYRLWIHETELKRVSKQTDHLLDGFNEAYQSFASKREGLLNALRAFAHNEFQ